MPWEGVVSLYIHSPPSPSQSATSPRYSHWANPLAALLSRSNGRRRPKLLITHARIVRHHVIGCTRPHPHVQVDSHARKHALTTETTLTAPSCLRPRVTRRKTSFARQAAAPQHSPAIPSYCPLCYVPSPQSVCWLRAEALIRSSPAPHAATRFTAPGAPPVTPSSTTARPEGWGSPGTRSLTRRGSPRQGSD